MPYLYCITTAEYNQLEKERLRVLSVLIRANKFYAYYAGLKVAIANPFAHSVQIYPNLQRFVSKRVSVDIGFTGARLLVDIPEHIEYALEFKIDHKTNGLVVSYITKEEYDLCVS